MSPEPRPMTRWPSASDVLIAAAGLGVAVAVRWAAEPLLATRYPFVTIFVVIAALSSWRGMVLGVPALVLGLIISLILFINPGHGLLPTSQEDWAGVALYVVTGSLIVLVGEGKVRAERRTVAAAME